jgi:hypothetical protein
MARPCALAKIGEHPFARARIGCRSEARAHALPGIRRERERGTSKSPPPMSWRLRFIFPSTSGKTR